MKFSVFVAGGGDRWDPREDQPSAKCHAMMTMTIMTMTMIMVVIMIIVIMVMMMLRAGRCK